MAELHVDLSPPQKGAAGYDVSVLGRTEDARRPLKDVDIQVFHNFNPSGTMKTDSRGRAVKVFVGLQPGSHTFELQVAGWAKRVRKDVVIPAEPPAPKSIADDVVVSAVNLGGGKFKVRSQILGANKEPIVGTMVTVIDPASGRKSRKTNKNGVAEIEIKLVGDDTHLKIAVDGTPIRRFKYLHV